MDKHIAKTSTYEACKGCEHSYLHQVIDTSHSLCQGRVEEGTRSGHLSTKQIKENILKIEELITNHFNVLHASLTKKTWK